MGLRNYQQTQMQSLRAGVAAKEWTQMLMSPTGSGKTEVAKALIKGAHAKGKRAWFIVDGVKLLNQTLARFMADGIQAGAIQSDHPCTDHSLPIQVATIQSLRPRLKPMLAHRPPQLVVIDEAHVLHEAHQELIKWCEANRVPVIGLSATPFRRGLGLIFKRLVNCITTKELTEQGFLVPTECYVPAVPSLKGVKTNKDGDWIEDELAQVMGDAQIVGDVVTHWKELGENRQTLVFACNVAHSKQLAEAFFNAGVMAAHIDGYMDGDEQDEIIRLYKAGKVKVLVSVGMLAKGFDDPATGCIVLARPTKSLMLHYQMCLDTETEVLTNNGWRKYDAVHVGDTLGGYNIQTGKFEWVQATDKTHRDILPFEKMYKVKSPHLDIRVIGGHDLVYKSRGVSNKAWKKQTAEILSERATEFLIPVSAEFMIPDCELTDDQIRFIGWVLTDGSISRRHQQITISQSFGRETTDEIERVIRNCGFKYKKLIIERRGELAHHAPAVLFTISKGEPRGSDWHLSGWGQSLEDYLAVKEAGSGTKAFPEKLEEFSSRQLSVLLEAMNLGDGSKPTTINYKKHTMDICFGKDHELADKFQALLVTRGFRCNKTTRKQRSGWSYGNDIIILRISTRKVAVVGGSKKYDKDRSRCSLEQDQIVHGEKVWCLTNKLGTLITRRNGKVAIMGNCGRVLRTNHGKFKGIIIDHAGNLLRNGKPTDELPDRLDMDDGDPIDRRKQDQQPEEKKDRACPKCKFMYSGLLCPKCGHEVMIKDGVAVANGKLVKLEDRKTVIGPNNKQKIFGELLQYARDKGKKDAWAQYAYQAFMGEPIKREFLAVQPVPTSPEISQWVKGYNVRRAKSPKRFA